MFEFEIIPLVITIYLYLFFFLSTFILFLFLLVHFLPRLLFLLVHFLLRLLFLLLFLLFFILLLYRIFFILRSPFLLLYRCKKNIENKDSFPLQNAFFKFSAMILRFLTILNKLNKTYNDSTDKE